MSLYLTRLGELYLDPISLSERCGINLTLSGRGTKEKIMSERTVSPLRLVVRCYAEELPDGQWQAFSLEFGLAAQADSFQAVKGKLDGMIRGYVYDALAGEDRPYARQLLSRRSPWWVYARYYFGRLLSAGRNLRDRKYFDEPMGLEPKPC